MARGVDLVSAMLAAGHGRAYDGGKRRPVRGREAVRAPGSAG